MARFASHFDSYLQVFPSTPDPVTVEQTVTASASVVVSVVSIVRPSPEHYEHLTTRVHEAVETQN